MILLEIEYWRYQDGEEMRKVHHAITEHIRENPEEAEFLIHLAVCQIMDADPTNEAMEFLVKVASKIGINYIIL